MDIAFDLRSYLGDSRLKPSDLSGYSQALGYHSSGRVVVVVAVAGAGNGSHPGFFLHGPEHGIPVPSFEKLVVEVGMLEAHPGLGGDPVHSP